jgi:uncharacterized UBP type Zn finger protein
MRVTERLTDNVRRMAFQRSLEQRECSHLAKARVFWASSPRCGACQQLGERWVHLRLCMTCGSVGCCDSSPHRHARAHADATGHQVIRSVEPGERWAWCYPDQAYLSPLDHPVLASIPGH